MKAAMSIDGRTASYTGDSKWITNELSRENVHRTRKRVAAIMVGINTVINDNPMLSCRCENPSHPIRIVCDSNLRIPLDCQLVKTANQIPLIVATSCTDEEKKAELEKRGVEVIVTDGKRVNLKELMRLLGQRKIDSLLLEGGSEMHASMLQAGLVDKLQIYIAPKIIGGREAKPTVGGRGVAMVKDAYMFTDPEIIMFGDDILIEYVRKEER
jgi:diaminohydroxyphosphoribosylaminopyrimidine deaminase/5-amino-6-(5-phosphoribosylamino)uracil reductase